MRIKFGEGVELTIRPRDDLKEQKWRGLRRVVSSFCTIGKLIFSKHLNHHLSARWRFSAVFAIMNDEMFKHHLKV